MKAKQANMNVTNLQNPNNLKIYRIQTRLDSKPTVAYNTNLPSLRRSIKVIAMVQTYQGYCGEVAIITNFSLRHKHVTFAAEIASKAKKPKASYLVQLLV